MSSSGLSTRQCELLEQVIEGRTLLTPDLAQLGDVEDVHALMEHHLLVYDGASDRFRVTDLGLEILKVNRA